MMQEEKTRSGVWFVLMAAVLWGTTGTSQAFAPAGFDPMVIGTLRLALGGGAMLLMVVLRSGTSQLHGWPLKVTFFAALFTALYQVCFFAGVAKTGVAVGTIVGIGSAPVAGGLLGYLFRGERPGRPWFVATALAIIGCVLLTLSSGGDVIIDPVGVTLAIGAGVTYAAYTLFIKKLLEKHEPDAVIAVVFCVGALMLAPLLLGRDLAWLAAPRSIAVILHLGLVTAALAYWFFVRGLQRVQVATAVTLSLAEPLTAGLLGLLVLGEQLNPVAFVGIALIFSGLAVLAFAGRAVPETSAEFGG
ncbi:MAG: EamA family transporter [Desulfuromonadales bacterium]|nr:EamA family transporter [Desulfuromonadales bacterium]